MLAAGAEAAQAGSGAEAEAPGRNGAGGEAVSKFGLVEKDVAKVRAAGVVDEGPHVPHLTDTASCCQLLWSARMPCCCAAFAMLLSYDDLNPIVPARCPM